MAKKADGAIGGMRSASPKSKKVRREVSHYVEVMPDQIFGEN
jgi:hypothetical protein